MPLLNAVVGGIIQEGMNQIVLMINICQFHCNLIFSIMKSFNHLIVKSLSRILAAFVLISLCVSVSWAQGEVKKHEDFDEFAETLSFIQYEYYQKWIFLKFPGVKSTNEMKA